MFAGQMACEALNWCLKRYIKEERPQRKCLQSRIETLQLTYSTRDERQGLRHAIVPCPVCHLLLRLADALLARTPSPHHLFDPFAHHLPPTTSPRHCRSRVCVCGCMEPNLSQLSHPSPGSSWMCSRKHIRSCVVHLCCNSSLYRLGRMGLRYMDCQCVQVQGPGLDRGPD